MGSENPQHYKSHPSGIECIQVIYPLFYGAGNAIKYLWRLGMKDEDLHELRKAMWYVIHSIDADLGNMYTVDLPFASRQALILWGKHEPAGYRKDAITAIYQGRYGIALVRLTEWYASIAGINMEDVELPEVPPVGISPYDVKDSYDVFGNGDENPYAVSGGTE